MHNKVAASPRFHDVSTTSLAHDPRFLASPTLLPHAQRLLTVKRASSPPTAWPALRRFIHINSQIFPSARQSTTDSFAHRSLLSSAAVLVLFLHSRLLLIIDVTTIRNAECSCRYLLLVASHNNSIIIPLLLLNLHSDET